MTTSHWSEKKTLCICSAVESYKNRDHLYKRHSEIKVAVCLEERYFVSRRSD